MRSLLATVLLLAGCNSLLGIPSGGDIVPAGDAPTDVSTVGNCESSPVDCAVFAVDRDVAQSPESIVLEGTFGDEVSVEFPDGLTQTATILGSHRARVAVPDTAAGGVIAVTTAGIPIGALPFRGASFKLGVAHFQLDYAQTSSARQAPQLDTPRGAAATVTIKDQIFLIGGQQQGGAALNDLEVTRINADGTLGRFERFSDTALVQARFGHTVHRIGNFVHVIGGASAPGNAFDSVESAPITASDVIGTFGPGPSMEQARAGHTSVVIGDGLYVVGGRGGDGAARASVERAPINKDGSLGPFAIVDGVTLTTPRTTAAMLTIGGQLYVFGGAAGDGIGGVNTIERAAINGDGTLQPFTPAGTFGIGRAGLHAIVLGTKVVLFGGLGGVQIESTVELATIEMNGNLGGFTGFQGRMAVPRAGASLAIGGNLLHVIGGLTVVGGTPGITALGSIEHTSIIADGGLDTFLPIPGTLVSDARTRASMDVFGRELLMVGGNVDVNSRSGAVDRSIITSSGNLGPFSTLTNVTQRSSHRSAILGNNFLLIGGESTAAFSNSIQIATFGQGGGLGAFVETKTLAAGRRNFTVAMMGGRLFVIGGESQGTPNPVPRSDVESIQILADGSLGPGNFTAEPNAVLNDARSHHCSAVVGDFLYVFGGEGITSGLPVLLNTVERAPFLRNAPFGGALGAFERAGNVPQRAAVTCAILGRSFYVFGGDAAGANGVEVATINPSDYGVGAFTALGGELFQARFDHRALDLGNGMFMIGGDNGTVTPQNNAERATIR